MIGTKNHKNLGGHCGGFFLDSLRERESRSDNAGAHIPASDRPASLGKGGPLTQRSGISGR